MDAATVSRLMSRIPERVARSLSGTQFADAAAGACRHAERFAHLVELLQWLGPLYPISRDDQRILGLVGPNGRPLHAAGGAEAEEEAPDADAEGEQEAPDAEGEEDVADADFEAEDEDLEEPLSPAVEERLPLRW
jgi:hypothetical protein